MLYSWLFPAAVFNSEDYSGKKAKARGGKQRTTKKLSELKQLTVNHSTTLPQSSLKYDQTNNDIVDKITHRNMYVMTLPDQDHCLGNVTFISDRIAMMPMHFLSKIAFIMEDYPEYTTKLVKFEKVYSKQIFFEVPMNELFDIVSGTDLESLDCVFVRFPRHVPQHCDITKFFLKAEDIIKCSDLNYRLVIGSTTGTTSWCGKARAVESEVVSGESGYVLSKAFKYQAATVPGNCGAIFTMVNTYLGNRRICGMHSAGSGSTGLGLASVITQEDVLKALEGVDRITQEFESEVFPQATEVILDGRFGPLYHSDTKVSSGSMSHIIKSDLYGMWRPALTAPARLSPFVSNGVKINPRDNAMATYCPPFKYIDPKVFAEISLAVGDNLEHVSKIDVPRVLLTAEQAIKGLDNDPDFNGISRSTSAGYPYNAQSKRFPGKVEYFGTGQEYDLTTPKAQELLLEVDKIISDAKNSIRHLHVYTDCLKDERRPLAKVEIGKTRLFSACPLPLLVVTRMYFGSFIKWCQVNRIENGFAVGVNPYSVEWEALVQKMLQFGTTETKNCGAGDYSGYDGSEKPVIHWAILDLMNRWYNDGNDKVREVLWLEIVNSRHIFDDFIYEWFSSMTSGCALTTIINNLYNHFCANYVYWKSFDFEPRALYTFYTNIFFIVFGDDNLFSVRPGMEPHFNEKLMSENVSDLGMKYTTELKGETNLALRKLTDVSFLKRGFRFEPFYGRFTAPLELSVILEMPYWTKACSNPDTITKDNVNAALRELCLHPPSVFDEWAPKIISAFKNTYGETPVQTRRSALLAVVDGADDWY